MNYFQVPSSVEIAYEKARMNNVNIRFGVADIVGDLSRTILRPYSYDIILDSAIFHIFSDRDRQRYITNLKRVIKPGGLYIQLCRSEKDTNSIGPRQIKKSDLMRLFSRRNGWTIESIEDSIYETKPDSPVGTLRAYLTFIRRNQYI
jgi:ubiquinone/menaquinone biosynthesis C-methylase UbiE